MSRHSSVASDQSAAGTPALSLPPIALPYLICVNVKCYRDSAGGRYFDPLWHRDLLEHARYLKNLTLASPCQASAIPPDAIAAGPALDRLRFIDLPATDTLAAAILQAPRIAVRLWREIGRNSLVHLGIAGWPIPFGWVAGPLARMRRKPYLVIVESAPWRLNPGMRAGAVRRCGAWMAEICGRWCVNHARLVIVTQEQYGASLLTRNPGKARLIPASWLHEEDVLSDHEAAAAWHARRPAEGDKLKVLFAGRLQPAKGILLLLEAMRQLEGENIGIELDILGQGELLDECRAAAQSLQGSANIRILGTMPYGEAFFRLLRDYHAVAAPNLSDEQPRIVYDAYSQALPVLAGDTSGMRACVEEGRTGLFVKAPDGAAWAGLLRWSTRHVEQLERMGMAALQTAREATHRKMHEQRWRLLLEMMADEERER